MLAWTPPPAKRMTGDLNLLRIQVTVQYRVARPVDYVLHSEDVERLLRKAAESSVSRALAVRGVDAVLRSERQSIALDIDQNLQDVSDRYQLGVTILGARLTDARPPSEVEADFVAAQSAESQRDRRINEANSYNETTDRPGPVQSTGDSRSRPRVGRASSLDRPGASSTLQRPAGGSRAIARLDDASSLR